METNASGNPSSYAGRAGGGSSGRPEPGCFAASAALVQYRLDHGRAFGATGRLTDDHGRRRR